MLKIYTLIHDFSLSTPIEVGGAAVEVVFRGGCKALGQNGEYSTTDPRMQQALENGGGFNRVYRLSKSFPGTDVPVRDGKPSVPSVAVDASFPLVDSSVLIEKVCATVNEAAGWLSAQGCRKSDVDTTAKAIAVARNLGYELKFSKKR